MCVFNTNSNRYLLLSGFYDQSSENIDEMIELSNAFIEGALGSAEGGEGVPGTRVGGPTGAVYVHCYAGVSRSATLCIAYLMCHCGLPFLEAMRTVRRARPVVCPNTGFMEQLQVYEQRLNLEREISNKLSEQIQNTLMVSERGNDGGDRGREGDRAEAAMAREERRGESAAADAVALDTGSQAPELETPVVFGSKTKALPRCLPHAVQQELVLDMDLEMDEPPVQPVDPQNRVKSKLRAATRNEATQQQSANSPQFAYIEMQ